MILIIFNFLLILLQYCVQRRQIKNVNVGRVHEEQRSEIIKYLVIRIRYNN